MLRIIRTGFQQVKHEIDFHKQTLIKAKLLAVAHVRQVEEIFLENNNSVIKSKVIRQTSVNLQPYDVELQVNNNRMIRNVSCTCVAHNSKKCKHVCALIYYINCDESRSKTSEEQQWGKPSSKQLGKEIYSKGMEINKLFSKKFDIDQVASVYHLKESDLETCPLKASLAEEQRSEIERACKHILNFCVTAVIDKIEEERCSVCCINLAIMSQDNFIYGGKLEFLNLETQQFYEKEVLISETEIIQLCVSTKAQAKNPDWHKARRLRITASSKAHSIKVRRKKESHKLAMELSNPKKYCSKAQEYGIKKESSALDDYKRKFNVDVINVGFFVSPIQPWLGVSLDGVVIEDGMITKILEIKCLFSCKKKPIIDLFKLKSNVSYLLFKGDNIIDLKESHQYYTQCQLQMYVTGVNVCDLFIWSPVSSVTVQLHRNEKFLSLLLPVLANFYCQYYITTLILAKSEDMEQ